MKEHPEAVETLEALRRLIPQRGVFAQLSNVEIGKACTCAAA
jgi:hypothetical protein